MRRRFSWISLGSCAVALTVAPHALAQPDAFPTRTVRIVVPFPPGGLNDLVARTLAQRMSEEWKQPVVVENRAGAGTIIGTEAVAKSPADGYTILLSSVAHSINPSLYSKLPYDPQKSLTQVSILASSPFILCVRPTLGVNTLEEFLAYAKAHPGKLTYGSTGSGGSAHLMSEWLANAAGVQFVHVPYKGMSPALADLLSGQVDFTFVSYSTVGSHLKGARLKPLAVSSAKRLTVMPELRPVAEAGYAGFDANPWWGLAVPAGTPTAVIDRISASAVRVLRMPEVEGRFREVGVDIVGSTPAEANLFLTRDTERWTRIVRAVGAKAD
jgi:tripartite-type tricarboxylate transporter receptor subunit TctC